MYVAWFILPLILPPVYTSLPSFLSLPSLLLSLPLLHSFSHPNIISSLYLYFLSFLLLPLSTPPPPSLLFSSLPSLPPSLPPSLTHFLLCCSSLISLRKVAICSRMRASSLILSFLLLSSSFLTIISASLRASFAASCDCLARAFSKFHALRRSRTCKQNERHNQSVVYMYMCVCASTIPLRGGLRQWVI